MATDTKVAHFHLALSVDQDIGGLHIWSGTVLVKTMRQTATGCYLCILMMSSSDYLCGSLTGYCADALTP